MAQSISVAEYYADKNIFITGATGFIGKALVEKLLRTCPRVGNIYMLIRPKHGKSVKDRLNKFIENPIFDNLRKSSPESLEKLRVVTGDTTVEALGISDDERNEVLNECNIVFHSAACVRFDLPLRLALDQNTRATKRVLELAERIKNLEVFLHISTSYCQHGNLILEEKLYPTVSPQRIMDLVDWMSDDMIAGIQSKLIHPHGNTYAYTKALSETVVSQYAGKFPIAIGRPSIVSPALAEPMPGWVDNVNGPTGLMIGGGKGVIRSMVCYEILGDGIPVDMTVNACILLAYLTALEKPQDIRVCNMTQSGQNAKTWRDFTEIAKKVILEYPFYPFLWVPGGSIKTSRLHHNIVAFFVHFLPAYFIDLILFLLGKKGFMMKIYYKIKYGLKVLDYYTTIEWKFKNDWYRSMRNKISSEEDKIFYTDFDLIEWESFMKNYTLGAQKYILKQDPADLPRARIMFKTVWIIDRILTALFYGFLLFAAYKLAFALAY